MFALSTDIWAPAVLGGGSGWINSFTQRFGVAPDVILDFAFNRAHQPGQPDGTALAAITCTRAGVAYEDDQAGNWYSFGVNVPRITNKGLLVEEARTNSIRNNSMQGAIVGTPGTLPTNWVQSSNAGLLPNVVATGSENGIDYIDVRYVGTPSGNICNLYFETTTGVAALTGQVWTSSWFYKLVSGTTTNITSLQIANLEYTSSGTFVVGHQGAVPFPTGASLGSQRVSRTDTLSGGATTANINHEIQLQTTNGLPIDITLRIGWPQLEQGAWATSPIRTTNAAVTRAADVVTLTSLPTFGGSFSTYGAGTPLAPTTAANQYIVAVIGGANVADIGRSLGGGGGGFHILMTGGINGTGAVMSPSVAAKLAGAFAPSDQSGVLNGGGPLNFTASGTPPVPTSVSVGGQGASQYWNGYITEAAIWATARVPNAGLQSGTL